ncbi:MAG: hypothetical protein QOG63_1528 [Thermoleophilaceae bacterium]|nr:hypothetical protein [Thermoleophilaceae bacterium]
MSSLVFGLALALAASVALNGSFVIQHVGSLAAPPVSVRRPLATLAGLFRSRAWLAGAALGMGGWALHVGALSQAPLALVQAFVAGGLALVAPVASRALGHTLSRVEWCGVAGALVALVLLCVGLHDDGPNASVAAAPMAAFLVLCGAAATLLVPVSLGLAGGVLYGAADVAIKGLTGAITVPLLVAAALATAGAFFAFQRGLQTGRPIPTIVLMTVGTTGTSILGGIALFGDSLGATDALIAVHIAAFVLVTLAAATLAPRTVAH